MNKKPLCILSPSEVWLALYSLVFVTGCYAQSLSGAANFGRASTTGNSSSASLASDSWMRENWSGNEAQYRKLRAEVYQASRSDLVSSEWVAPYAVSAQQKPNNPASQFALAYAIYRAHFHDQPATRDREYSQAVQSLAKVHSPHTYEFARLRFLLASSAGGNIYPLRVVGGRLLRRVPNDAEVKARVINVLDDGLSDSDKQQALIYAKQLVRADPVSTYGYGALSWTYFVIFLKSSKLEDGDNAITACRQCLQHMAKGDPSRPSTERYLRLIQTIQSNHARRQNG